MRYKDIISILQAETKVLFDIENYKTASQLKDSYNELNNDGFRRIGLKQIWLSEKLGNSFNRVVSYAQNRWNPSFEDLLKDANSLNVEVELLIQENY